MHLGEMTHRMESVIEHLGTESLQTSQLEPLLSRFDAIQNHFTKLRAMPEQSLSLPEASPATNEAGSVQTAADVTAQALIPSTAPVAPARPAANQTVRVRAQLLDRLVNQAGEVMITRSRLEARLGQLRGSLGDLSGNLTRLRSQLRDIELQSESQMQTRLAQAKEAAQGFDPLEFDRFTRVQELTRMMAESVHDVATVQTSLQRTIEGAEDDLIAQARQARELQRDLLRTRMVEFDGIAERLYGVVRQASKDAGKTVKLDIQGGSLDMDRSVLDRMAPAFEHLLRNAVAHGIEAAEVRVKAGKPATGTITLALQQQSNDVSVTISDDGAGLDLASIREKARLQGQHSDHATLTDAELANLIFDPGFTTAAQVTELSGRGIGLDVVRMEVNALGGRIETTTQPGLGTQFKLVLPLTTAVTQVVMLRMGDLVTGVPANLVDMVRRVPAADLARAYQTNFFEFDGEKVPFFWAGALLQASASSDETRTKTMPVAIFRSAGQRVALHVDEVLGNQEVVVKNLGPQLSRMPGLTGMSVLASGAVVLIYNPVALVTVYGEQARQLKRQAGLAGATVAGDAALKTLVAGVTQAPLVLVVDDSITVRRVTQRLLKREGFRVALANDGLQALERLQEEKPAVVLSDIEMPRMDGFDLARNIRADEHLRDLPIIMITSRIAEKHRDHARELGVDHYLGKPYSEDELIGLVRQYCAVPVNE
jgi:chemosensory pili system protein ChpA (sensor histidine kinase/response regulator)